MHLKTTVDFLRFDLVLEMLDHTKGHRGLGATLKDTEYLNKITAEISRLNTRGVRENKTSTK